MMTVIDFSIIYSACWYITKKFVQNPDDIDAEKFFDRVNDSLVKVCFDCTGTYDLDRLVICLDSRDCFRKEILPEYKGTREKKPQRFYDVKNHCIERLWEIYHDQIRIQDGLEADDLVYLECVKLQGGAYIVSSDADLHQAAGMGLFNQYIDPVHYFDFFKHRIIEVDPLTTMISKVLRGDKGDNVPSPVIGRVTTRGINYIAEKMRNSNNITRQGIFMLASSFCEVDFELFDKVYDCVVYHPSIYKTYLPCPR